ncbi:MAG TPA: winged helix-turn-helix transcriptional regulator [Candidatus Thermoplasmatota archaeon]|nr:winged helix-turn-helix transcriptional regulator [Candidatus Thermoplasmatota archaeon]
MARSILAGVLVCILAASVAAAAPGDLPGLPVEPGSGPPHAAKDAPAPVRQISSKAAPPVEKAPPGLVEQVAALLSGAGLALSGAAGALGTALGAAGSALLAFLEAVVAALSSAASWLGAALASGTIVVTDGLARAADAVVSGLVAFANAVARGLLVFASAVAAGIAALGSAAAAVPSSIPPEHHALAGGAAGAAAAVAGLSLLHYLGFLAPLYSRLAPRELLDNGARARIFELIRANPGTHASAIAQAAGTGWGTTMYHLARLREARMIVANRHGNKTCYFPMGIPEGTRARLAATRHDRAREIADFVRSRPGATQKEVAASLGMSPALVSWHVRRLQQAGVLGARREGRATLLVPAAAAPAAPPGLPATAPAAA